MKINPATAEGPVLDWMVAKAEKLEPIAHQPLGFFYWEEADGPVSGWYDPTTDWSIAGPIIEREKIGSFSEDTYEQDGTVSPIAVWYAEDRHGNLRAEGPTPLVAAMRCFVVSKLGTEVEVPDDLV